MQVLPGWIDVASVAGDHEKSVLPACKLVAIIVLRVAIIVIAVIRLMKVGGLPHATNS